MRMKSQKKQKTQRIQRKCYGSTCRQWSGAPLFLLNPLSLLYPFFMPRGPSIHRVHPVAKRLQSRENPHLKTLRARVSQASTEPGIYRWLDANKKVLYVGKAKNLRKRLHWYVSPRPGAFVGPWRQSFLEQIADFDVTVTNTELEALILETNLIKQLKPKYNVLMKDDKNYLYIKVTVKDPFPRVESARKIVEDGSRYFGPTTSGEEVRRTLALLRRLYPFRTCKMEIEVANPLPLEKELKEIEELEELEEFLSSSSSSFSTSSIPLDVICTHRDRTIPCLDFHIQQCSAPCIGTRTPEQYWNECIEGVLTFLKGNRQPARALLEQRMHAAATARLFEQAAQYRDMLQALDDMQEKQLMSDTTGENCDVLGIAVLSGRVHVVALQRRNGRLIGESHYELAGQAEGVPEVLEQFIPQYYDDGIDVPETIIVPADIAGRKTFEAWLTQKRGHKVRLLVPERGRKSDLLQLAEKNAMEKARQHEVKWEAERANTEGALEGLRTLLELPALPRRIEGYDISHLGGSETVGSMVVALGGKSANDHYRSFTVRTVHEGDVDDYRALQEVLRRRLRYLKEDFAAEESKWKKEGVGFGKARKAEGDVIAEIIKKHPQELREEPFDATQGKPFEYAEFLMARLGEEAIGFAHLHTYAEKTHELRCLWVAEGYRGGKLGLFLVRKALKGVKKGKAYVITSPSMEEYYGQAGFRYVLKPPAFLQERLDALAKERPGAEQMVLVYEARQNKTDPSLTSRPDLLMIDGGKGQLSSVVEVLQDMELDIPVIGLAKREEEVFVPGRSDPVPFPKDAQAKFLLMRLRDEAHRSANRHRETIKAKRLKGSILDEIPGIGDKTKADLLKKFGSVAGIRAANDEQLQSVLSEGQLRALKRELRIEN